MSRLTVPAGLVVSLILLVGCATAAGPAWSYVPVSAVSSNAPPASAAPTAASATSATSQPADPAGDASVLPSLTPKAQLQPVPAGRG